jgi:hypothetical protein
VVPARGVAERVLPADDWALYRRWDWNDARHGQDPTSTASSPTYLAPAPWSLAL